MPVMNGVEAITAIRQQFPDSRFIVLTTYDGDEDIYRALQAGAHAYLLKDMFREELLEAIRTVHAGQRRIPGAVATRLAERMAGNDLTAREGEVLQLIASGKTNREIATGLAITEGTVKGHVNNILSKLGVSDRTQAVTTAIQRGIVHLEIKGRHRIGFSVSAYDKSKPLVIDPEIVYSTYLGGSIKAGGGFEKQDNILAMAVDAAGNTYVAGATNSIDFPVTPNAFQSEHGSPGESGGRATDAFVSKFDPTGRLVYSTYLGGNTLDQAYGIAAESVGNIYVTGQTMSPNFPTTPGAYRTTCFCAADGHPDGFVVKLNSTGSLAYSTLLGVETYDSGDIAVDAAGNTYVVGVCGPNLPIVNGLQVADPRGVFLAKLNAPGSALLYSTNLDPDTAYAMDLQIKSSP